MRKKKQAVVHCAGSAARGVLCRFGCIACGACADACRLQAVSVPDGGPAVVDREKCVGCGLCVKACPQQIIRLEPAENTILVQCCNPLPAKEARKQCEVSCVGCGICEKNCPAGAIHVRDGCAVIDQTVCIACGMCAVKCPRGVIRDANGILTGR